MPPLKGEGGAKRRVGFSNLECPLNIILEYEIIYMNEGDKRSCPLSFGIQYGIMRGITDVAFETFIGRREYCIAEDDRRI